MLSTMSMLRHNLNAKAILKSKSRSTALHNPKKGPEYSGGAKFDQYTSHSPLQISKHKVDELRSKIFFEHPPIPNRVAKFVMLFAFCSTFMTGLYDKVKRRNKRFTREQDKQMFRLVVPFVQAMEDLRFTALEQKNYMVTKAMCDMKNPSYFENVRWRYHQEDI